MMTKIYIARHGNTFNPGDVVTRVGARTDMPLTEAGKQQGVALGKHFSEQALSFDVVFCSCLQRTRQTAKLALKEIHSDIEPVELDFLREIDYGPDENIAEEIVQARIGLQALDDWENKAIPPEGWIVDPDQLKKDWISFFDRSAEEYKDKTILVVTSNGIARFALQAIDENSSHSLKLKTGAYGIVQVIGKGHYEIERWNIRP